MIDHLCGSTPKWKTIIESIKLAPSFFHKAYLTQHPIGNGENAFQVAEELHTFLGICISDTLYGRRVQMEGGKAETGNGFEFWRQLFLENEGSGALINAEGRKIFQEYPKCAKMPDSLRQVDGWKQLLDEYAPEMYDNPKVLLTTIMSLIPE